MKAITMTFVLFLIVVGVAIIRSKKISYDGNQLWRIYDRNDSTMQLLLSLQEEKYLSLWGMNSTKVDVMVNAKKLKKIKNFFRNINYKIVVENLQKIINEENRKPNKTTAFSWDYYHNLEDIYNYLHYLEKKFPKLCSVTTIGQSVEKRPIKLLKISNKKPQNKAIFIEGGIHAREWISPCSVTYIINQITKNYNKHPFSNKDWYFVPVLNPDGYEYSYNVDRLWRKNRSKSNKHCIGVDLNRNFGYNWYKTNGSSIDPCSNSYRGRKPLSEPETSSIAKLLQKNNINWASYVAVHSYGQYIVYPWASDREIVADHADLQTVAMEMAMKIPVPYTVGPAASTIYAASGTSMDFARGNLSIKYAFLMELRDEGTGFILPTKHIHANNRDVYVLIKTLAKRIKPVR